MCAYDNAYLHDISAFSARQEFVSPANTSCACPGERLIYSCTVVTNESGRATVWNGSVFDCAGSEITLLHKKFSNGTIRECNGGAILGRSVSVVGNCFTSQLNVTVSTGLNNRTVMCFLDSEAQHIGESLITVAGMLISTKINNAACKYMYVWIVSRVGNITT